MLGREAAHRERTVTLHTHQQDPVLSMVTVGIVAPMDIGRVNALYSTKLWKSVERTGYHLRKEEKVGRMVEEKGGRRKEVAKAHTPLIIPRLIIPTEWQPVQVDGQFSQVLNKVYLSREPRLRRGRLMAGVEGCARG